MDLKADLTKRRQKAIEDLAQARVRLHAGGDQRDVDRHDRIIAETTASLVQLEGVEATLALAAAQRDVAAAQSADTKAQQAERSVSDEATFWFRRFATWVGIANAATLAAVLSAAISPENRPLLTADVVSLIRILFLGVIAAGLIPLMLWRRATRDGNKGWMADVGLGLAIIMGLLAAAAFAMAVSTIIGILAGIVAATPH